MTLTEQTLETLTVALPRMVCPSQLDIGDLVRLGNEPLPVVITSGAVIDDHRIFTWVSPITTTAGLAVIEGQGVHDAGERIMLLARGETVRADRIGDGDLLVFEDRDSLWGTVIGVPRVVRADVIDIAWRAGSLPRGLPRTIGFLQYAPSRMVRRAARGVTL